MSLLVFFFNGGPHSTSTSTWHSTEPCFFLHFSGPFFSGSRCQIFFVVVGLFFPLVFRFPQFKPFVSLSLSLCSVLLPFYSFPESRKPSGTTASSQKVQDAVSVQFRCDVAGADKSTTTAPNKGRAVRIWCVGGGVGVGGGGGGGGV